MKLIDQLDIPDPRIMATAEGRRLACKHDPLLFAYHYLKHHLVIEHTKSESLSEFHLLMIEYGKTWAIPGHKPERNTFITARGGGKSTWIFLILPIWAAAYGHQKFIAAFSDSATQAKLHLKTMKNEFNNNARLRADFPELCQPQRGAGGVERNTSYNDDNIVMQNGFVCMARGADTASLGMKFGTLRPTMILLDDIEGGESNYSNMEVQKRLRTLLDDIFPLNIHADVAIVGTTTKPGAIIDQIRQVAEWREDFPGPESEFRESLSPNLRWAVDEKMNCVYVPALVGPEDDLRSIWEEQWPLEYLLEQRHTRSFAKNFMCRPINDNAEYWDDEDIKVCPQAEYGNTIISIDPAVTTNKNSDSTGIAIFSRGINAQSKNIFLRHVEEVKLSPDALKEHVAELIEEYGARVVLVESNMGGDLWKQLFAGLGAKFKFERATVKKEIRAQSALDWYQKDRVFHAASFPSAEAQLKNFPNVIHDDMVDAISAGVKYFLGNKSGQKFGSTVVKYNENY